jgi:hypothetical protein
MAAGVLASATGLDPGKRVPDRKRGLAVDVLGLLIAVTVLSASNHDNAAGIALLDQVTAHDTLLGIDVKTVQRNPVPGSQVGQNAVGPCSPLPGPPAGSAWLSSVSSTVLACPCLQRRSRRIRRRPTPGAPRLRPRRRRAGWASSPGSSVESFS